MSRKAELHLSISIIIENSSMYFVSHRRGIFTYLFPFLMGVLGGQTWSISDTDSLEELGPLERVADGPREYILKQNNKSSGQETLLLTFGVVY